MQQGLNMETRYGSQKGAKGKVKFMHRAQAELTQNYGIL
jgi:hypothetical protein